MIKKLKNEEFRGDYLKATEFIFDWCSEMQRKINEIIDYLNSLKEKSE